MAFDQSDTIVAIATPVGVGAIGIVRVSGPQAVPLLQCVWKNEADPVDNIVTHRVYYGKIVDISTGSAASVIDETLIIYFRAPHSYTGEDVVEVHGHGNPYLLDQILQQFVRLGARVATPGEFTQRAYLNGKIDLTQAEAVADLIAATSERAQRAATEQLHGRVSRSVRRYLDALTELRAFVEATIDFPEEDIEMMQQANVVARCSALLADLRQLAATYAEGRYYREGVRVVFVGRPNAGKSSLLNALLGEERAIVHHQPGTTRDVIEEVVQIDGISFRLIDTAGLRTTETTEVEQIGIERTRQQIETADIIALVIDGSIPFDPSLREYLGSMETKRLLLLLNKCDLPTMVQQTDLVEAFPDVQSIALSATRGDGLPAVREAFCRVVRCATSDGSEGCVITNARHKAALDGTIAHVAAAHEAAGRNAAPEFVAEHLRGASEQLGAIVGAVTTEELLTNIFGRFCIGK